ncbi:MAG: hypothetical protein RLZ12_304 [Bacillota bacterium]|jgi:Tfp pilus assembly protein PilV
MLSSRSAEQGFVLLEVTIAMMIFIVMMLSLVPITTELKRRQIEQGYFVQANVIAKEKLLQLLTTELKEATEVRCSCYKGHSYECVAQVKEVASKLKIIRVEVKWLNSIGRRVAIELYTARYQI